MRVKGLARLRGKQTDLLMVGRLVVCSKANQLVSEWDSSSASS